MKKISALFSAFILVSACTAPDVRQTGTGGSAQPMPARDVERLLLEAESATPPRSAALKLSAAAQAMAENNTALATRIIEAIESPHATEATTRDYTLLGAELALLKGQPGRTLRLLDDARFRAIRLNPDLRVRTGRLRAQAYRAEQSYLAGARELIYLDGLIPAEEKQAHHDRIFSTLLLLPGQQLRQQAKQSVTGEVRGWLSLASIGRQFRDDPLRQLQALQAWRDAWPDHPAAVVLPGSLQMLAGIVAELPEHVALILPLSGELGRLGRAIRDGYIAAHYQLTPNTSLNIYDATESNILELVSRAVTDGAELIIGPLDRARVTSIARQPLTVPVIALNRSLGGEANPNLYQFGLAPEDESIQVADRVFQDDKLRGLVIAPDNDWGARNLEAFAERFADHGGVIVDSARFSARRDYSDLIKLLLNIDTSEARASNLRRITGESFRFAARRRQDIDFVFLLANATQARGINPTLAFFYAEDVPVYATSHVHVATDSKIDAIDLNGIRFCDIPWKLTRDDALQQVVTDAWSEASEQLAAFYALGVDVHRLYPRLQQLMALPDARVFGSTGILTLNEDRIVNRKLMWAQFRGGEAKPMTVEPIR